MENKDLALKRKKPAAKKNDIHSQRPKKHNIANAPSGEKEKTKSLVKSLTPVKLMKEMSYHIIPESSVPQIDGVSPKPNIILLAQARPVLMEASIHALMRSIRREEVGEIIILENAPTAEVHQKAKKLANYYGMKRIIHPDEGLAWNTGSAVNYCIKEFPAEIYIKVDDDVFITHPDFVRKMLRPVLTMKDAGASVALLPLNQYLGYYCIKTMGWGNDYRVRFGKTWDPNWIKGTLRDPRIAFWLWGRMLDMKTATKQLIAKSRGYIRTMSQVSIGTVCFTHRLWEKMKGFKKNQEKSLTAYLAANGLHYYIDSSNPAFHFSYNWYYHEFMKKLYPRLYKANKELLAPPKDFD